jgi:hypothetical protein
VGRGRRRKRRRRRILRVLRLLAHRLIQGVDREKGEGSGCCEKDSE